MNVKRLVMVISTGVGAFAALTLLWLLADFGTTATAETVHTAINAPEASTTQTASTAQLSDATPVHYVAVTGTDSSDCATPAGACRTIQYAIDQAGEGDEIRVAMGTYSDLNVHPRKDITITGVVTQVAYISKTVTLRGGYTTTNWSVANPVSYPTTLDAQRQGRVIYITGDISPTIEGLRITGGDAAGLGGISGEQDAGGGMYIISATATVSNNWIFSNTNAHGAGLYLYRSNTMLSGNVISGNVTSGAGGGLCMYFSDARVRGNTIVANVAGYRGGGVLSSSGTPSYENNVVKGNATDGDGGGLYIWGTAATLIGNEVISNTAGSGGGLYFAFNVHTLTGNAVAGNVAAFSGGGMVLLTSSGTMVNNLVVQNRASTSGSGLYFAASSHRLVHNTIADNAGGDSGLHLTYGWWTPSKVILTNTIVGGHSVGVLATTGNTATLESTLWNGNITDWQGNVIHSNDYTGDPAFVNPGVGDYHIGPSSAALDKGVDVGTTTDIDGDPRPLNLGPDLGADEYTTGCYARLNDSIIYDNVQAAVDASTHPTDIVKVAGYCTGVNTYGGLSQVVYLSKTLTMRGGYTITEWSESNPISYPTTLDAQRQGRVLYVTGDISPTLEGLRIKGGDASGLGGYNGGGDYGGGMYIITASAVFSNNWVFSNSADYGGGLALWYSDATLNGNTVISNTATEPNEWGGGGGVYLNQSPATLHENTIGNNTTNGSGGGVHLTRSDGSLIGNIILSNTAQYDGGGIYLNEGDVDLSANVVSRNAAEDGGGLYLWYTDATISANTVLSNTADNGGGAFLWGGDASLTNNAIAGNRAGVAGSGLHLSSSSYRLLHTTVAGNTGGDRGGIYVNGDEWWGYASVAITNTILAGHDLGIDVRSGNTATLESTLWHGNNTNWQGTVYHSHDYLGDPAFLDPDAGDYHIGPDSAAIDAGVDAGVTTDIDGQPRPFGLAPDLGADEFWGNGFKGRISKTVVPTHTVKYGDELTYTLFISAEPGTEIRLFDPLSGTTFIRYVEQPVGVIHSDGVITGTLVVTPTNQITVSFVTQVGVPGIAGMTADVSNRACVIPFHGTLGWCTWSNEVTNTAFRPHKIYYPIVLSNH